jgi:hypothetical protein
LGYGLAQARLFSVKGHGLVFIAGHGKCTPPLQVRLFFNEIIIVKVGTLWFRGSPVTAKFVLALVCEKIFLSRTSRKARKMCGREMAPNHLQDVLAMPKYPGSSTIASAILPEGFVCWKII